MFLLVMMVEEAGIVSMSLQIQENMILYKEMQVGEEILEII